MLFALLIMGILAYQTYFCYKTIAVEGDELVIGHLFQKERIPLQQVFAVDCVWDYILFKAPTNQSYQAIGRIQLKEPLENGRETINYTCRRVLDVFGDSYFWGRDLFCQRLFGSHDIFLPGGGLLMTSSSTAREG